LHHLQRLMHEIWVDQPSTSATSPRTWALYELHVSSVRTKNGTSYSNFRTCLSNFLVQTKHHHLLVLHKPVLLVNPDNKFGYGYELSMGMGMCCGEKWVQTLFFECLAWRKMTLNWTCVCAAICNSFSCVVELVNVCMWSGIVGTIQNLLVVSCWDSFMFITFVTTSISTLYSKVHPRLLPCAAPSSSPAARTPHGVPPVAAQLQLPPSTTLQPSSDEP
jgi:hypothetical protein